MAKKLHGNHDTNTEAKKVLKSTQKQTFYGHFLLSGVGGFGHGFGHGYDDYYGGYDDMYGLPFWFRL